MYQESSVIVASIHKIEVYAYKLSTVIKPRNLRNDNDHDDNDDDNNVRTTGVKSTLLSLTSVDA